MAFVNRYVNPVVRAVLRSPAHGLLSRHLLLITVTGRRTGRPFTIPVGYRQRGNHLAVSLQWPERKRWWRNLDSGAPVAVLLRGAWWTGAAHVEHDEQGRASGVVVELSA